MDILATILKQIEDMPTAPPLPFNGATRLVLSRDVFDKLASALHDYGENPLVRPKLQIEVSPLMSPGSGWGCRPRQDGDPEETAFMGATVCWICSPKTENE